MFHSYHNSIVGTKHEICEDYSKRAEFEDCLMTVIADGVGSAELSDIGSKTITDTVIDYFSSAYSTSLSEYEAVDLLKKAYISAYEAIIDTADKEKRDKYCFDSTVSAVIITSKYVIWGHCGDGAIFKINASGFMSKITCEQTGDFSGEVYAFLSGEKYWSFGITSLSNSYAFIMSTDGILEFLKLVLADPSDKFIFNLIQQIQKRNFEEDICDDLIKQILSLKTIADVTRDDKTLAIIVDDQLSLKPSKDTPNPIVYSGTDNYFINFEAEEYQSDVSDIVDINVHNFIINEINSNMVTFVPSSNRISLMQVLYPLRDVELVLDPSDGTKKSIQLSHYIITRTISNYKMLCKVLSDSESFKSCNNYTYFSSENNEIIQRKNKEDFLIKEINDFDEFDFGGLIIKIYLFRDFFLFDFVIPDTNHLSIDFQAWSYSYLLASALMKTMRAVKKNISSIPKPVSNFTITINKVEEPAEE